jgi:hypothetical protein
MSLIHNLFSGTLRVYPFHSSPGDDVIPAEVSTLAASQLPTYLSPGDGGLRLEDCLELDTVTLKGMILRADCKE